MPHPSYSPNLTPYDFCLFPKLKDKLRGRKFTTDSDVITEVHGSLKQIPQKVFPACFEKYVEKCDRFISPEGKYFEKD